MAKRASSRAPARASRDEMGQGLSISTIIIAAIGLIVLVVLVAVFTGQIGRFAGGVEKEKRGVTCEDASPTGLGGTWTGGSCPSGKQQLYGVTNADDVRSHAGMVCCTR